jgi:hypothetical protein
LDIHPLVLAVASEAEGIEKSEAIADVAEESKDVQPSDDAKDAQAVADIQESTQDWENSLQKTQE